MEPTVLAGPIEFSPAEIALIIAVLAAIFLVVTAPGWAAVAWAARRRRTARGPGPAWPAALGGAVGGLLLCCTTVALLGAILRDLGAPGGLLTVPAAWCACWAVAYGLFPHRPSAPGGTTPTTYQLSDRTEEGWGR
jgi:hypothetical protein